MMGLPTLADVQLAALKWAAVAAVLAGTHLAAYEHGRHVVEGEKAQAERDIALAYAGEIVKRQQTADGLATENATLRAARAQAERAVTKEVTRYVQVTPPAQRCTLPGTWRLRHDAAALGALPQGPAAGPLADAAADPVTDAAALDTVAENYAACRDAIAKLEAWQRRQRALTALTDHAKSH